MRPTIFGALCVALSLIASTEASLCSAACDRSSSRIGVFLCLQLCGTVDFNETEELRQEAFRVREKSEEFRREKEEYRNEIKELRATLADYHERVKLLDAPPSERCADLDHARLQLLQENSALKDTISDLEERLEYRIELEHTNYQKLTTCNEQTSSCEEDKEQLKAAGEALREDRANYAARADNTYSDLLKCQQRIAVMSPVGDLQIHGGWLTCCLLLVSYFLLNRDPIIGAKQVLELRTKLQTVEQQTAANEKDAKAKQEENEQLRAECKQKQDQLLQSASDFHRTATELATLRTQSTKQTAVLTQERDEQQQANAALAEQLQTSQKEGKAYVEEISKLTKAVEMSVIIDSVSVSSAVSSSGPGVLQSGAPPSPERPRRSHDRSTTDRPVLTALDDSQVSQPGLGEDPDRTQLVALADDMAKNYAELMGSVLRVTSPEEEDTHAFTPLPPLDPAQTLRLGNNIGGLIRTVLLRLQQDNQELNTAVSALSRKVSQLEAAKTELEEQMDDKDRKLDDCTDLFMETKKELKATRAQKAAVEAKLRKTQLEKAEIDKSLHNSITILVNKSDDLSSKNRKLTTKNRALRLAVIELEKQAAELRTRLDVLY